MLCVRALALVCALGFAASAQAEDDNPFARPGASAGPAPSAPSPLDTLELRGVLTLGETTVITLFDTSSSRSTVATLGATVNGITVSDYQAGDDSVLVQSGGRERRVKIKKAQIVTMVAPPPPPTPAPQGGPQVAGMPPPPPGPNNGAMDDQEVRNRMERVAQEIRRRREMRREMMERAQQQPPNQPQ